MKNELVELRQEELFGVEGGLTGIEEAALIIGIVSGVIGIADFAHGVYDGFKDARGR